MKKLSALAAAFCLAALATSPAAAGEFGADQLERMSVFVSNFTELNMFEYAPRRAVPESGRYDLIDFAIRHNEANNFRTTIRQCPDRDCTWGGQVIDRAAVEDALERYFDFTFETLPTFDDREDGRAAYHFDGKRYHFDAASGEETLYARVKKARRGEDGTIIMTGDIYNAEDKKDVRGTFTAQARDHEWKGKKTWALMRLTSEFKD